MIIKLPNGKERELDNNATIEEKVDICNSLTIEFEEDISRGWDTQPIKYFLNGLSNYLCWDKTDAYHDRQNNIMSNSKEKQMERVRYHGRWRKDTIFTDLRLMDKTSIFGEVNDDEG